MNIAPDIKKRPQTPALGEAIQPPSEVSLSREQAITFGMLFLPIDKVEKGGSLSTQLLRSLSGVDKGIIPDIIKLDPAFVATQIREDGIGANLLKHLDIKYKTSHGHVVATPEIVAQLLKFITFLNPIDKACGNRIKIVKNDPNGLIKAGFSSKIAGSVLIRVAETGRLHFHQDIYSLFRKTFHQEKRHDKEVQAISDLIERTDKAVAMLEAWKTLEDEEKSKMRGESRGLALTLRRRLGVPVNKDKKRAIELGFAAIDLTDGLNRLNILASRTRYTEVARRLLERVKGVTSIDGYNTEDRISLFAAILEQETVMRQIAKRSKETGPLVPSIVAVNRPNFQGYFRSLGMHGDSVTRLLTRPWIIFQNFALSFRAEFELWGERRIDKALKSEACKVAIGKLERLGVLALSEMATKGALFELIADQQGAQKAIDKLEEAKTYLKGYKFVAPFSGLAEQYDLAIDKCRLILEAKSKKLIGKAVDEAKKTIKLVSLEGRLLDKFVKA